MNKKIERIKKARLFLLNLIKDLTPEQLNQIPAGYNNNIIWNLGHLFTTQQRICYLRSGLKTHIENISLSNYLPQSKPENQINDIEINEIKDNFISIIDLLENDVVNNEFTNYTTFMTPYGFEVSNIDEALDFVFFHEGFHTGYILALKRALK